MSEHRWVGRAIPQVDIDAKLRGETAYLADLRLPGMLDAAIVRSPIMHGIIRHVDVTGARRTAGVRAVITAADTPETSFGPYTPDWEILARRKVRYIGDEVAAVAATSANAARNAASRVHLDLDELPAVFDPHEALAPGAPVIWEERPGNVSTDFAIDRGDVESEFRHAAYVFEDNYSTNRIYHAYLEPIGAIADYADGQYTFYVPTHIPYRARLTYAAALGVRLDQIRIVVPPIGGSFGAKYEMNTPLIAAVLARETGRPVRILFDREEDAQAAHPRPPFFFHHRLAVSREGQFLARETDVIGVAGARTYWSPTVLATAVHRVDALYHFRAMTGRGRLAYTNENPTTCMRGFGNAECLFGFEQMIDDIAERLGMDPAELRLRNIVRSGDTTLHGWKISSSKLPECLDRVRGMSGFQQRRHPTPHIVPNRHRVLRGMGIAIGHHVSGYRTILADYDGSSAILRLGGDGAATLFVGEPDIGQGHVTVLAQLVAERVGLPAQAVRVQGIDSAFSPAAVGTLASRATTMAGNAALAAADDAKARLAGFMAEHWQIAPGRVVWADGALADTDGEHEPVPLPQALQLHAAVNCGLPVLGQGVHRPNTEIPDETKYGNPSAAYPFAAHVAEVEVDCATGQVRVTGYWAAHDSGTILNPATARGQVVGGIAQGLGWALMENVAMADGRVANPNFLDYRIPGAGDMPPIEIDFVAGYEPNGPLGAKSLGEVALNPVVAAIANAIHNATGIRCHELPISPEKLWTLLHERTPSALRPAEQSAG